jgi:hypothetical protein
LTELCHRAAKASIRESIATEQDGKTYEWKYDVEIEDLVPVITRAHF